ncbi:MAG: hypothetical protein IKT34_00915 [Clostridia bacterium]|nr:hypothetical protein [Clostridia bacterium]
MNENREKKASASENLMDLMTFTAYKAKELADANNVLGDPIHVDGMTIYPVSKISAGFAGGGANIINASAKKSNSPAGSGASVKLTPISFLVVANGSVSVVSVSPEANEGKQGILDKVSNAVKSLKKDKNNQPDAEENSGEEAAK